MSLLDLSAIHVPSFRAKEKHPPSEEEKMTRSDLKSSCSSGVSRHTYIFCCSKIHPTPPPDNLLSKGGYLQQFSFSLSWHFNMSCFLLFWKVTVSWENSHYSPVRRKSFCIEFILNVKANSFRVFDCSKPSLVAASLTATWPNIPSPSPFFFVFLNAVLEWNFYILNGLNAKAR